MHERRKSYIVLVFVPTQGLHVAGAGAGADANVGAVAGATIVITFN